MIVYAVDGALYGPYLWFDAATLNVIKLLPPDVPITVSPTTNAPDVFVISINLGIKSTPLFPSRNW